MTETIESAAAATKKRAGGLNSMLLADLKAMAGGMGISGAGSMKKAQLVDAIKASQSGGAPANGATSSASAPQKKVAGRGASAATTKTPAKASAKAPAKAAETASAPEQPEQGLPVVDDSAPRHQVKTRTRGGASRASATTPPAAEVTQPEPTAPELPEQSSTEQGRRAQPARARRDRSEQDQSKQDQPKQDQPKQDQPKQDQPRNDQSKQDQPRQDQPKQDQPRNDQSKQSQPKQSQPRNDQPKQDQPGSDQPRSDQPRNDQPRNDQPDRGDQPDRDDLGDEEGRTGRNRRRRGRDRNRTTATTSATSGSGSAPSAIGQRNEPDTTIHEDDVLVPAAGILDVLDNYAFVRTSGYLPGVDDVYVSLSMVRKFGLRRGDAIVGQVRQPREGERKEKFNPMVRIDSVNGAEPSQSLHRAEFVKLTPLYPTERLRLETGPDNLIGRVIDIAAPIGKGQRGLIVSPTKAGTTTILRSIANSVSTNNPECHLMVVLLDERPEEVTDFQRSVKGEVISSTFDRPAADHTIVAELAIERAKRLVELGHDVVVLIDGITRLGRAYNLATPASGRILPGGVDSAALHPPKRFFGAARNIEDGGSLTIVATALVESGSTMDEVIFDEFTGTANMELRLRGDLAEKRLFPAIDAAKSGTRHEELLMSAEELAIVWKLRRVLSSLDGQQALELLLGRLQKSHTNIEFLMQVQKSTPTPGGDV